MSRIYDRIYRIGRNGSFYKESGLFVDGRQIFHSGGKRVGGKRRRRRRNPEYRVRRGIGEWLEAEIQKMEHAPRIGFDGRTVSIAAGKRYEEIAGRMKWSIRLERRTWLEKSG